MLTIWEKFLFVPAVHYCFDVHFALKPLQERLRLTSCHRVPVKAKGLEKICQRIANAERER